MQDNNKKIRIVFVTRSMWAGGAERVISELLKYMVTARFQCSIVTIDDEKVLYHIPAEADLFVIGKKSENPHVDKFLRYKALRKTIVELKPDVVLSMPEDIGIFVIPALLGTKIPVVVSERNNPVVMPNKKVTRIFRKVFYPFGAGFVFQTKQASDFFSPRIRKKSTVLPNPLDLTRIPEKKTFRNKEIVAAGRLDKQKNFPLLINAFGIFQQYHPEYSLKIFGEGMLRSELESLAARTLNTGTYSLPGRTSSLLGQINGAAMFVLTSDYEGMPNVLIEAMAIGVPVISTNCPAGGSADLIEDGVNGLLVPVGDVDKLVWAMKKIAESDEFADEVAKNAEVVKQRLDSNIVAAQWSEYVESIVG